MRWNATGTVGVGVGCVKSAQTHHARLRQELAMSPWLDAAWPKGNPLLLRRGPSVRDEIWLARANEPLLTGDLQRLCYAVGRGRPFGGDACTKDTAELLDLESCSPPNGGPRKQNVSLATSSDAHLRRPVRVTALRRADVCAIELGPAPRKHAPPKAVYPRCPMGQ